MACVIDLSIGAFTPNMELAGFEGTVGHKLTLFVMRGLGCKGLIESHNETNGVQAMSRSSAIPPDITFLLYICFSGGRYTRESWVGCGCFSPRFVKVAFQDCFDRLKVLRSST